MNYTRRFAVLAIAAMVAVALPCVAQEQQSSQPTPDLTGTGIPGHIAIWQSSTALRSSTIYATGGNIGIGTTTPAAKLDVAGAINLGGNLLFKGSPVLKISGLGDPNNPFVPTNVVLGIAAFQQNGPGGGNTAIGSNTLQFNTVGFANTANGYRALESNTSGSENTAIGEYAMESNTTGQQNTAIGTGTLFLNSTGSDNAAIGDGAMKDNTTGQQNTAVGTGALSSNSTGSYNIAVGDLAGYAIVNTNDNIDIGNQGTSTDSGTVRIGTPLVHTSAYVAGIYGSSTGLANVGVVVDANGNLGTVPSSRRYKEDIQDMSDSSDGLMKLRPVTFRYKKAYEDGAKPVQYGLIAEEVEQVYPDLVARSADGQIESVRYQLLDPMLLNELQKQHATIADQKEQIQLQDRRIEEQAQQLRSVQEQLAKIQAILNHDGLTGSSH